MAVDFILPLLLLGIYLLILGVFSYFYHSYLEHGSRKSFVNLISSVSLYVFFLAAPFLQLIKIGLILFFAMVVLVTVFLFLSYMRRPRCANVRRYSVDGLEFIVCSGGPINAWYDPKKRKIYISDSFLQLLNEEELKSVYYHEEGHRKNRYWILVFRAIMGGAWLAFYFTALPVILLWYFHLLDADPATMLNLLLSLFSVACSLSLVFMLWLWFEEHEADAYSVEKLGAADPLISSLLKQSFLSILEERGVPLQSAEIKISPMKPESFPQVGKKDLFSLLFKESFKTALKTLDISGVFRNPLPQTHPHLRLRIYKILKKQGIASQ